MCTSGYKIVCVLVNCSLTRQPRVGDMGRDPNMLFGCPVSGLVWKGITDCKNLLTIPNWTRASSFGSDFTTNVHIEIFILRCKFCPTNRWSDSKLSLPKVLLSGLYGQKSNMKSENVCQTGQHMNLMKKRNCAVRIVWENKGFSQRLTAHERGGCTTHLATFWTKSICFMKEV